jgi:ubiquinone/menaquinone biosynthesis C-methylase UbiE
VLDLGVGTGRLPLLLADCVDCLVGLDLNRPMLLHNRELRQRVRGAWELAQGDMRFLPFPSGWADLTIAGWSIGHSRGWFAEQWQMVIGQMLGEMQRVTARGGTLIILETLGTGSLQPASPSAGLTEYYTWLENDWSFTRRTISTDYQFESVEQAVELTEFFFGPELAALIRHNGWVRLPEWTGVWSKPV